MPILYSCKMRGSLPIVNIIKLYVGMLGVVCIWDCQVEVSSDSSSL